jgi:hypothetical protein
VISRSSGQVADPIWPIAARWRRDEAALDKGELRRALYRGAA